MSSFAQQRKVDFFLDMKESCVIWSFTWGEEKDSSKLDWAC